MPPSQHYWVCGSKALTSIIVPRHAHHWFRGRHQRGVSASGRRSRARGGGDAAMQDCVAGMLELKEGARLPKLVVEECRTKKLFNALLHKRGGEDAVDRGPVLGVLAQALQS
jgi:hypothetical protein